MMDSWTRRSTSMFWCRVSPLPSDSDRQRCESRQHRAAAHRSIPSASSASSSVQNYTDIAISNRGVTEQSKADQDQLVQSDDGIVEYAVGFARIRVFRDGRQLVHLAILPASRQNQGSLVFKE